MKKQLNVRLSEKQIELLKKYAKLEEMSISEFIRHVLRMEIKKRQLD